MPPPLQNRLASEPSLYLRQHARNPVEWYAWGEPALSRARAEDRPILLSIGYSACHWCHVMERECFESEEIAALMNRLFVCIKVDREERPDLDAVYMKALQGMTGRGGWPMTVFLTPGLLPYYAGTYFPPADRGGLPGFPRVLASVARAYREQRDLVEQTSTRVGEFLRTVPSPGDRAPDRRSLTNAGDRLLSHIDGEHGGFGSAPKFPNTSALSFLLGLEREGSREDRAAALRTTLDRMAQGGIYDHLGGGFHRYSVDRYWTVPHFEKMLYDQAAFVDLYREAWSRFGDDGYRAVALHTLDYVVREMTAADGGFYATQDADSEGEEGKYFVWSKEEMDRSLPAEDRDIVCAFFGVCNEGNFDGANVLQQRVSIEEVAADCAVSVDRARTAVARGRRSLLAARASRVAPVTDRKILTDWNGLMIGSMAAAGRLFDRADLVDVATQAARFVTDVLWAGGRLRHFHAEGETRVDAFLDDYAFFGRGCLELYAATSDTIYLRTAERCAEMLLGVFADPVAGGFFFTSDDGGVAIAREKGLHDGAVPSGNAVATELMYRLHAITGDGRYANAAEASLATWGSTALDNPYGGAQLLAVAHRASLGYGVVVVAETDRAKGLLRAALGAHAPELAIMMAPASPTDADVALFAGKAPIGGRSTAYVCRGATCSTPIDDAEELAMLVGGVREEDDGR